MPARILFALLLQTAIQAAVLSGLGPRLLAAPQDILYIRAEFLDKSIGGGANGADISDATWLSRLATMNDYAEEYWVYNSYQQISEFDPDYTDVYTLDPIGAFSNNVASSIRSAMRNAAASGGWNLSDYDQVVYSFPSVPNLGGGALGSPGNIWMPSANPWPPGFTHEFGHALGVGHASSFEGLNGAVYPGEHREGRDGLWMMGSESSVASIAGRPERAPINLPMRYKMGFVDEALVKRLPENASEVVRIHAFDRPSLAGDIEADRSLAAVFEHDGREWWVSFAPTLAQRWVAFNGDVWADGVIVHELTGDITRVLDLTPGSQGGVGNTEDYIDTRDGALRVGQSFTFPDSSLQLAPLDSGVSPDGVPWIDFAIDQINPTGDYNNDGIVNAADYTVWRDSNGEVGADLPADGSGNGRVNLVDYNLWRQNYGVGRLLASIAVPEPIAAVYATLASGLALSAASQRRL